jgi:calcium permeable stress-gated cation channel
MTGGRPQQIAVQTATAPAPFQSKTYLAPEPRDIIWSSMPLPQSSITFRDWFVIAAMALLLFTWIIPITALSTLLSYTEIQKVMPWLARLIDRNANIRAVVQNSLPSVAMVSLNACLPFLLEGKCFDAL